MYIECFGCLLKHELESSYRVCYQLTYFMLQPLHLICIDNRTYRNTDTV
ncbi:MULTISPECIES: DUF6888 family protein [Nostocales]